MSHYQHDFKKAHSLRQNLVVLAIMHVCATLGLTGTRLRENFFFEVVTKSLRMREGVLMSLDSNGSLHMS
jgi:hypothetical protein